MNAIIWLIPVVLALATVILNSRLKMANGILFEYEVKYGDQSYNDIIREYNDREKVAKNYSYFFFIESFILWMTIVLISFLQSYKQNDLLSRILATGIYIPFVFLLCSWVIQKIGMRMLRANKVSRQEISDSIFFTTLFLDLGLFLCNWEMALFLSTIILGKIIWLDGNMSQLREVFSLVWKSIKKGTEIRTTNLVVLFGKQIIYVVLVGLFSTLLLWLIGMGK